MSAMWTEPVVVRLPPYRLDDRDFHEICRLNPEMRIEQTCDGEIIVMPPTGGESGIFNSDFNFIFVGWAKKDGTGVTFDSSTLFTLPNGARRSPDLSWVKRSRWEALTKEQRKEFSPICPDFVVELRSPSDSLKVLQAKMEEYIANGAQLGWLLDPIEKRAYIYRAGQQMQQLNNPAEVSGEAVLRGFVLNAQKLWE